MGVNSGPSDYPARPLLTGVLAEMVAEEAYEQGLRPQAFDTFARYSDAGRCARAIAYGHLERALDLEAGSDARQDPAGQFVMWRGTMLHEFVMGAIVKRYGGQVEVASSLGSSSGHCDWIGTMDDHPELGLVVFELKTEGSYGFDRAVGLRRKGWTTTHPEGPRIGAKIQGALNALANEADTLVIGVLAMEAVSIGLAEKIGMGNLDRICAEWRYSRAEWEPWARAELGRLAEMEGEVASGQMPARLAVGQEGQVEAYDPHRPSPLCNYCRFFDLCRKEP